MRHSSVTIAPDEQAAVKRGELVFKVDSFGYYTVADLQNRRGKGKTPAQAIDDLKKV